MKLFARELIFLVTLILLVAILGALFILTVGSKRGSKRYRLKVAVLGMIVAIWGGGMSGCYRSSSRDADDASAESDLGTAEDRQEDRSWIECYVGDIPHFFDPGPELTDGRDGGNDEADMDEDEYEDDQYGSCYLPADEFDARDLEEDMDAEDDETAGEDGEVD